MLDSGGAMLVAVSHPGWIMLQTPDAMQTHRLAATFDKTEIGAILGERFPPFPIS